MLDFRIFFHLLSILSYIKLLWLLVTLQTANEDRMMPPFWTSSSMGSYCREGFCQHSSQWILWWSAWINTVEIQHAFLKTWNRSPLPVKNVSKHCCKWSTAWLPKAESSFPELVTWRAGKDQFCPFLCKIFAFQNSFTTDDSNSWKLTCNTSKEWDKGKTKLKDHGLDLSNGLYFPGFVLPI